MRKVVFLDRDGTIVKHKGFITDESQIELEYGAAEGIKVLNELGYLVIVVTNQPQIARGMCAEADVERINKHMVELLSREGARIDGVYYCPHHPERNHPDIPPAAMKYRIPCDCRKPNIGMLKSAADKFDIDFNQSFVIGDRSVDIETGRRAGCKTILVKTGELGEDALYGVRADYEVDNLIEAARVITMSSVVAVILAGGRGERLRPLTDAMPKPMVLIAGKPVLEYQIDSLRRSGILDIVICGSYRIEKIKEYFGDGERFGVKIVYPEERDQMGTGGAIKNAQSFLKDAKRIVVVNGDKMIGLEFDFAKILAFDAMQDGFCTILVRETDHPIDSDIVELDSANKVIRFIGRGQSEQKFANSGLFILKPEIFNHIPDGKSNLEKEVIFKLIGENAIYGFVAPQNWFIRDIGTPERLEATRKRFEANS